MKKLLVYLKGYEKETVLAPLFKMLEALFELFVPLVMAAVIDVGIGGHDRGYVIRMCLVLIALGVIGHYRPVFCSESSYRILYCAQKGVVCTYSESVLHRDGQSGYVYADY